MIKKTEFTPGELDRINAVLTKAIDEAYPDLEVTPYKDNTADDEETVTIWTKVHNHPISCAVIHN